MREHSMRRAAGSSRTSLTSAAARSAAVAEPDMPPVSWDLIFVDIPYDPDRPDRPAVDGPLALSWSGGKDSALALWALREGGIEPQALITTVTEEYERISMHGVRRELLRRQAEAADIPLVEVRIPPACVN